MPFVVIFIVKFITFRFLVQDRVAFLYLPYLVSLPLYFWWGPRVFWPHALAEVFTPVGLHYGFDTILFYGLANAAKVFVGYFLYEQMAAKTPLKSVKGFLKFAFWALLIQNIVGNFLFLAAFVEAGAYATDLFWRLYVIDTCKDFAEALVLCYPILIFVTPWLRTKGWARRDFEI